MLHVVGGGRASSLYRHPVRESRIWVYREPCIPDIPLGAISCIPGIPGIPFTATASTPASAATFSVSTVQAPTSVECPSVGIPTSVADSTSVLSISSSDAIPVTMVNPTSVVESMASARCLANPITGLSTVFTTQQRQTRRTNWDRNIIR